MAKNVASEAKQEKIEAVEKCICLVSASEHLFNAHVNGTPKTEFHIIDQLNNNEIVGSGKTNSKGEAIVRIDYYSKFLTAVLA